MVGDMKSMTSVNNHGVFENSYIQLNILSLLPEVLQLITYSFE